MTEFAARYLAESKVAAGYVIFSASYFVFAFGRLPRLKIDRTAMAIIGAVAMIACRIVSPGDAAHFVDASTIVLLFSMMVLFGFLHLAGFFVRVTNSAVATLHPRHLLAAVILTTGVLSALFVNDIVCLVMVPLVLGITRRLRLQPLPYLLAVATASNIGSVATITGNPQNMLIGSYSGISYSRFLLHLGPVAIIGLTLDWVVLRLLFPASAVANAEPATASAGPEDAAAPRQRTALSKAITVLALVLVGFFAGVPPALVAAIGAALILLVGGRDPRALYAEVNWELLVFFVGLFVIVGGAENIGLTRDLFRLARLGNLQNSGVFSVTTALLSNIVSNVPAVMLLKSVVPSFANPSHGWLLLAMASTLAGNLTLTGSVANLIVVETARREVHIGFRDYLRVGVPVTVLTMICGWAWLHWTL